MPYFWKQFLVLFLVWGLGWDLFCYLVGFFNCSLWFCLFFACLFWVCGFVCFPKLLFVCNLFFPPFLFPYSMTAGSSRSKTSARKSPTMGYSNRRWWGPGRQWGLWRQFWGGRGRGGRWRLNILLINYNICTHCKLSVWLWNLYN